MSTIKKRLLNEKSLSRVICAEELMRVMVSLGNPRTEEEIKVTI